VIQSLADSKKLQRIISNKLLTAREIEVLKQICDEKQNKEIAEALHITENTVEYFKKQLYLKTKANSVVGLVKYAIRAGIAPSII
jgi:DNA-binding CsgD family transcriptional regulator